MNAVGNLGELLKAQMLLNQKENVLVGLVILVLFELFSGMIKEFIGWSKGYLEKKFRAKVNETIVSRVQPTTSELFFERNYNTNGNWDRADAILHKVLQIPASRTILVIGQLEVIKNGKEFDINRDIKFQLLELKLAPKDGTVEGLSFRIFSETNSVCQLREFVEELVEEYLIVKKNNLGNKLYFFDHIVDKKPARGVPFNPKIRFSKHHFVTNRTLDNVFHETQEELKHRVNFFLEHKDWYDKRGIPHTLGLLFYGIPGSGKTSSIKAIANLARRHIININLSAIRTKKQLKKLFYDERLEVAENMESPHVTEYIIPIEKRMYVIEDIDCLEGELLLKRGTEQSTRVISTQPDPSGMNLPPEEEQADLDLATILNIVDGTLETPGRILIISSNFPEKLDEALIRPGRIDMIIEYKKCNHKVLQDMFTSFYDQEPDNNLINNITEYKWTPAEVAQILFKNFSNPLRALQDLIELEPSKYFKFSHVSSERESVPEPVPEPVPESVPEPVSQVLNPWDIPPGGHHLQGFIDRGKLDVTPDPDSMYGQQTFAMYNTDFQMAGMSEGSGMDDPEFTRERMNLANQELNVH